MADAAPQPRSIIRIMSIDIGIKNLAFCVLEVDEAKTTLDKINILHLADVNLLCVEDTRVDTRFEPPASKMPGGSIGPCSVMKKAKHTTCGTISSSVGFDLPKLFKGDYALARDAVMKTTRKVYEGPIPYRVFFCEKCAPATAKHPSRRKISQLEIQKLARKAMIVFDTFEQTSGLQLAALDLIGIELQPRFNQKMKTLSNLLFGYFVHKTMASRTSVKFISARKKLAFISHIALDTPKLPNLRTYSGRKNASVLACYAILAAIFGVPNKWSDIIAESKKEDDFTDCIMQGLAILGLLKLVDLEKDFGVKPAKADVFGDPEDSDSDFDSDSKAFVG